MAQDTSDRLSWQVATQIGIWLISVMLAYGLINTRLQVLEVKYDRITQDIQEMKADLKQVISLARGLNIYPNPPLKGSKPSP